MMRSFVAGLLAASFSLQLTLVAGNMCAMSQGESARLGGGPETLASAAMGDMEMSVPVDEVPRAVVASESSSSEEPWRPCDEAASPPSGHCVAPCSPTFTIATSLQSNEMAHAPTHALPTTALEPPSRSKSPEPPPPRA